MKPRLQPASKKRDFYYSVPETRSWASSLHDEGKSFKRLGNKMQEVLSDLETKGNAATSRELRNFALQL